MSSRTVTIPALPAAYVRLGALVALGLAAFFVGWLVMNRGNDSAPATSGATAKSESELRVGRAQACRSRRRSREPEARARWPCSLQRRAADERVLRVPQREVSGRGVPSLGFRGAPPRPRGPGRPRSLSGAG